MDRYRRDHYELKLDPKTPVKKDCRGRYIWTDRMEKTLIAYADDSTQKELAEILGVGVGSVRMKMIKMGLLK